MPQEHKPQLHCLHSCLPSDNILELVRAELSFCVAEGAVVGDARKVGARDVDARVEVLPQIAESDVFLAEMQLWIC